MGVPPSGDPRRLRGAARRAVRVAVLGVVIVGPACAATSPPRVDELACTIAPDELLRRVETKLDAFGTLRNGRTVQATNTTIVSAEFHLYEDPVTDRGDILSWATRDGHTFHAVDVRAREESSWPAAGFDVLAPGVISSRGCVDNARGFFCPPDPGLPPEIRRQQCERLQDDEERRQEEILRRRGEEQGT